MTAAAAMARAIDSAVSSRRSPPSDLGFLDSITEEEKKVLAKHFPNAKPSGTGVVHLDRRIEILDKRAKWRARIATWSELVWLTGKAGGVVLVFGFAWQHFVA